MSEVAVNRYTKTRIITADPVELVIIAYEGAIYALESAKLCIMEARYEEKEREILKAQDFISELHSSLNMEAGKIATALAGLYKYMIRKILSADANSDAEGLEEIIQMLKVLKDTWETIRAESVGHCTPALSKSQSQPRRMANVLA